MTLSLQGSLHNVTPSMSVSVKIPCANNCPYETPIIQAEFDAAEYLDHIIPSDVEEAISEQMTLDGWERGNCPVCVERFPNLAKQDHEDREADEDRGGE